MQILDQAGFEAMIAKLKDQKPAATPKASASAKPKTVKLTVPPSQVHVTVQNGTGQSGLAGQVSQALAQEHFRHRACRECQQQAADHPGPLRAGQPGRGPHRRGGSARCRPQAGFHGHQRRRARARRQLHVGRAGRHVGRGSGQPDADTGRVDEPRARPRSRRRQPATAAPTERWTPGPSSPKRCRPIPVARC